VKRLLFDLESDGFLEECFKGPLHGRSNVNAERARAINLCHESIEERLDGSHAPQCARRSKD